MASAKETCQEAKTKEQGWLNKTSAAEVWVLTKGPSLTALWKEKKHLDMGVADTQPHMSSHELI